MSDRPAPRVSVVLSCYNAARWLEATLESVLAQSFEDFELVAIDDGSLDETRAIIERYHGRDARIIPVFKANTGLADSLNVGLGRARGVWIARLDADDICERERLARQLDYVERFPHTVLLGSAYCEINDAGEPVRVHSYPQAHPDLVRNLERMQRFFAHSSAFYRAQDARAAGGYNPRILRAEDWRLWLSLSARGELACLPDVLVRVRTHDDQISFSDGGRRQIYDTIAATACHFIERAGAPDPSVAAREEDWLQFLSWVEREVDRSGYLERRSKWFDARASYFAPGIGITRVVRTGLRLVGSGYCASLLLEKVRGSALPRQLARAWLERAHANGTAESVRDISLPATPG